MTHSVVTFQVTDLWLHRRTPLLAFTQSRSGFALATLAGDMNLSIACVIMAAITLVNKGLFNISACNAFDLLDSTGKGMAVIRISMQGLNADNPVTLVGRSDTNFTAELISFMCFALTDTFNLRSIDTVELVLALFSLTQ